MRALCASTLCHHDLRAEITFFACHVVGPQYFLGPVVTPAPVVRVKGVSVSTATSAIAARAVTSPYLRAANPRGRRVPGTCWAATAGSARPSPKRVASAGGPATETACLAPGPPPPRTSGAGPGIWAARRGTFSALPELRNPSASRVNWSVNSMYGEPSASTPDWPTTETLSTSMSDTTSSTRPRSLPIASVFRTRLRPA